MNLFGKPLVDILNPKSIMALKNPETGQIINAEISLILGQIFDLGLLGQSCLTYETTTVTDCDGNETTLPLQIAEVLLKHEKAICEALSQIDYINNNCCDSSQDTEILIYNEFSGEPDEWTVTENSSGANVTLNSANDPYIGSVGIEVKESDIGEETEIVFTNDSTVFVENIKELRFRLKNENANARFEMKIVFRNGTTEVTNAINITEGFYGFSNNNTGHAEIVVPIDQVLFSDVEFDNFILSVEATEANEALDNIFLDYFRLFYSQGQTLANQPPTVSASSDQTIQLPIDSITLNSFAEDSDGIITSYMWEKLSGGSATIVNSTFASTSITGLQEGLYVFRVTVTDNEGATASDTVFVTVLPANANLDPIADAGAGQLILTPQSSITLDGSGSSDPDGFLTTYLWEKISGGSATITDDSAVSTTVTGLVAGNYTFRLTVTDNEGATNSDEVNITVQDAGALVAVNIEIDLGDCVNIPDWVGAESVWIEDLPSVASGGDFNLQNGDVVYSENTLTTPFNGGDQLYAFRGVQPTQIVNNRVFRISATGVVSEMQECNAQNNVLNMNYDSSSASQPDTYEDLTFAILANGYSNNSGSPVAKFKIKSLPSRGELGLQGNPVAVDDEISLAYVNSNFFAFWADDLDGLGAGGDYSTSFTYTIIDSDGVESQEVTLDVNATDTATTQDATFYSPETSNNCLTVRCVKVTVPQGQTRTVTISKSGNAGYTGGTGLTCVDSDEIVTADKVEVISSTKIYTIGLDAATGNGNSSSTVTISVSGSNSLQISRIHESPVINC